MSLLLISNCFSTLAIIALWYSLLYSTRVKNDVLRVRVTAGKREESDRDVFLLVIIVCAFLNVAVEIWKRGNLIKQPVSRSKLWEICSMIILQIYRMSSWQVSGPEQNQWYQGRDGTFSHRMTARPISNSYKLRTKHDKKEKTEKTGVITTNELQFQPLH